MGKNKNLLRNVSDLFTEETLKDILAKNNNESNKKDIEILSWDFEEASSKGDSYLSTVDKITIKGKIDGKLVEVKLVVKSLPRNIGRRKTYRSTEFFHNEIMFYSKVIPKFRSFLQAKEKSFLLYVPKCLAFVLDGQNDFIVLENVSPLGFCPISRQNCLDYDKCCSILHAMARFHGISFAYKDQQKEEFSNLTNCLIETYFSKDLWKWYERFHAILIRIAKDALAKEYPGSKAEKKFNSYKLGELYMKSAEFHSRQNMPTSVVIQGDSWMPNFLMRNLPEEKQVLILDFQLANCSSPVLDISFFIYSCIDKIVRDEYFDKMLETYYEELSKTISQLGSNPEKLYPWNLFMQEVKEQFIHGLNFALESVPFSVLSETETFDLDVIKDDNAVNIADVWTLSNIETKENRRRLADIIVHAVENNFL